MGRYRFTNALIQRTLADELSIRRRGRPHARIAETLEELCGQSAEAHASKLAHHLFQAETLLGAEKLVCYSLMAGERVFAPTHGRR